jgi:membrane-associated protease RseP (regulator of RpoE activity)
MDQARHGCVYCFSTLDPHDQRDGYGTFVACTRCNALYHTACWQRHPSCVGSGCLSEHAKLFDVPAPSPLTVLQKTKTELPQPPKTVYQFGWLILTQGQILLYLILTLGALLLFGIMSRGFVPGITTKVGIPTLESLLPTLDLPQPTIAIIPSATLPAALPTGTPVSVSPPEATTTQPSQQNASSSAPKPTTGMQVTAVEPDSPADAAGFRVGQILVSLNEQPVDNVEEVRAIVAQNVGRPINAVVWLDGVQESLTVIPNSGRPIGVDLCALKRCLPLNQPVAPVAGMRIVAVDPGSPADAAGLRVGQILVSLNEQPVDNVEEVRAIVQANNGVPIVVHIIDKEAEFAISMTPRDGLLGVDLCALSRCP